MRRSTTRALNASAFNSSAFRGRGGVMALRHASSGTGSGSDVAGRNEGGPGYTSDREQQVSNDMMATNTANKRLTDDYATPIGSMSKDNVSLDPKLNQREGPIPSGADMDSNDIRRSTEMFANNPMTQGHESDFERAQRERPPQYSGSTSQKEAGYQNPRNDDVAAGVQ